MSDAVKVGFVPFSTAPRGILVVFCDDSLKFGAATRKALGVPTIMNLLGPLANPAGVTRQVVGVAQETHAPLVAEALGRLGVRHAPGVGPLCLGRSGSVRSR